MEVFSYDSVIVSRLFFVVLVELSRFDVRAKIKMANIYTLLVAVAWNIIIFFFTKIKIVSFFVV